MVHAEGGPEAAEAAAAAEPSVTVWAPLPEDVAGARVTDFATWLRDHRAVSCADYDELWRWSVTEPTSF